MCSKTTSIAVTLWSLVLLPVLCVGGAIGHACECLADAASHTRALDDHDTDSHGDTDCHHESDCDDDPCAQIASATRQRGEASMSAVFDSALIIGMISIGGENATDFIRLGFSPPNDLSACLPLAPSDIPLLV